MIALLVQSLSGIWLFVNPWTAARQTFPSFTISRSEVAQSCPTLCDPMDCSLPGSSIHGILQARILEWVAISFSRGSSQPRDQTRVSLIAGRRFNLWATREAPSPEVCSNSCPLVQWCYLTISSSAALFSFCLQSFPTSGSFPVSPLFASGGQRIGASVSTSVLPVNIQSWIPSGLTGLISLLSKWLSRIFSSTTILKHQFFGTQPSLWSNSHVLTWLLEKPQLWLYRSLLAKWCLLFNTLSRFVIAFLSRSKHFLI